MPDVEDPRAAVPWFSNPPSPMTAPTAVQAQTVDLGDLPRDQPPGEGPEPGPDPYEPDVPRIGRTDTRTRTSTSGEAKPATVKEVGQLVAAVLVALAVAGSTFVRWRTRNRLRLRQPSRDQAAAVGEPLGRIAYRHIPLPQLVPDLADAIEAAVGLNRYLDDGPLTVPADHAMDSGMPADLNQEI